jgi:hypothetical protein
MVIGAYKGSRFANRFQKHALLNSATLKSLSDTSRGRPCVASLNLLIEQARKLREMPVLHGLSLEYDALAPGTA